jgi:hypothetical protein
VGIFGRYWEVVVGSYVTVVYHVQDWEAFAEQWEGICKELGSNEELPVKVTAVSKSNEIRRVEKIEEILEAYDNACYDDLVGCMEDLREVLDGG